ncbi:alpha beta hydrolase fold family [Colletotrichum musicola]|uniref:Alpha beta hydrolase fold family n=1 Tax=Colletotrichum musicola TaxID=2175873 RepID=A0A8H6NXH1_9PEZI|nr:alpha beta hydrolase fold family [Colletotrichum musicola]
MIGRTLHEYVFIRICIALVRYPVIPYAAVLTACLIGAKHGQPQTQNRWATAARWIVGLMVVEVAYAVWIWTPYRNRLKAAAKHPAPSSPDARQALFDRCMATVTDPEHYIRGWFLGADLTDIRRDNVREFLLWAFFDQAAGDRPGPQSQEVDRYVAQIEVMLGRPFEPGRGPAKCLRLTLDDVETKYRSVWWYAIIALLDAATHMLLVAHGFQYYAQPKEETFAVFPPRVQQLFTRRRSSTGLGYWYLPHERSDCSPVVFFHGIGIGLWVYIRFLADISAAKKHGKGRIGIIALEILPVSFRLTKPPLGKDAFLEQLTGIIDHHGWDRFVLTCHSYGSVLATHVLRCPELQARIPSAVLVDPVSILLHLPDVAYNFTRRQPKTANEWQLWYFASTDPGVAHCLGRYFFWRENAIWAEELAGLSESPIGIRETRSHAADERRNARRVTVCLSGQDLIVDSHAVASYLTEVGQRNDPAYVQGNEGKQGRRNVAASQARFKTELERQHGQGQAANSGIDVLWFPDHDHAQAFDSKRERRRIVDVVRGYCEE